MAYADNFTTSYKITYSAKQGPSLGASTAAVGGYYVISNSTTLGSGSTASISPKFHGTTSVTYEGTAFVNGQFAGIVVYDPNNSTAYLLTNSTLTPGEAVAIDYAANPTPGSDADFNVETGQPSAICFLEGTEIAAPGGPVAVDSLQPGDHVLLADGRSLAVTWVGRQTIVTRFADPARSTPVRIRAGALGENLPVCDLLVSPGHAILVDGVLAQAGALVNGSSILRESNLPPRFTYFHVEVAEHALLLAEGVPAESFIDNADHGQFDNWDAHQALHGGRAPAIEMDLPLAKSARQVPAELRRRLQDRAARLFPAAHAA